MSSAAGGSLHCLTKITKVTWISSTKNGDKKYQQYKTRFFNHRENSAYTRNAMRDKESYEEGSFI